MTGTVPSPRPRWAHSAAVGAVLVMTLPAGATLVHARVAGDCARTPQVQPRDAIGVSLDRARSHLAHRYATRPRQVRVISRDEDAVELGVWDAGGEVFHGAVRLVRESGGWLVATSNTCD
jgi:hypothetical protein